MERAYALSYRMKMTAGQSRRGDNGKRLRTLYRMKMTARQLWIGDDGKRLCKERQ